jgi:hypothetical protein
MQKTRAVWATIAVALGLLAGPAGADDGEAFWANWQKWNQSAEDLRILMERERINALSNHREPDYIPLHQSAYVQFLAGLGSSKGDEAWRQYIQHALIILRLRYPALGHKVEDLEKELRALWAGQYKPDKTTGLLHAYDRYVGEKQYAEAVRIADEAWTEYGWTWEAREWLERLITAMRNDPAFQVRAYELIDRYAARDVAEVGANATLHLCLAYLRTNQRWDQAARIVESCLKAYRDCDWEPEFLSHAMQIHMGRADAAAKAASNTPPPEVAASVDRAAAAAARAVEHCPLEPWPALALLQYFQWAQARGAKEPETKDAALARMAQYLAAHPASPQWLAIWQAAPPLVRTNDARWTPLAATAETWATNDVKRAAALEAVLAGKSGDPYEFMDSVCAFVEANPDTPQARKAVVDVIASTVRSWVGREEKLVALAGVIRKAFPASPVFRSQQFQALAAAAPVRTFGDGIYQELIAGATSPLQTEWYYRSSCRDRLRTGYSIGDFRAWVTKYPRSYDIPDVLQIFIQRALYDLRYADAAALCQVVTYEDCAKSLTVARMFAGNIDSWLLEARKLAAEQKAEPAKPLREKDAGGLRPLKPLAPPTTRTQGASVGQGGAPANVDFAAQAGVQANLIEAAQSAHVNLGSLYAAASRWEREVRFTAQRGAKGRDLLRQKEYRNSYSYFWARAYEPQ